jgi:hypothetical protein
MLLLFEVTVEMSQSAVVQHIPDVTCHTSSVTCDERSEVYNV